MFSFVNSGSVQPIAGQEVTVCTLGGGPFDFLDAYVQGGGNAQLQFRVYATVAGLRSLVAQASYVGAVAARLVWTLIDSTGQQAPLEIAATSYDLVVFSPQQVANIAPAGPVQATLAGCNQDDAVANAESSGNPVLPASAEVQITTAAGFQQKADVAVSMTGLPAVVLRIYANCGAGSVKAPIATVQTGGSDNNEAALLGQPLSVANAYYLTAQRAQSALVAGPNVQASLSTYHGTGAASGQLVAQATTIGGGGAVTVDTGYKPPDAHASKLDTIWSAYDAVTPAARAGNGNSIIRANGGVTTIAGSTFGGSVGDAGLNTAAVALGVSTGGTITVAFTPPVGYAQNVSWVAIITPTENPTS